LLDCVTVDYCGIRELCCDGFIVGQRLKGLVTVDKRTVGQRYKMLMFVQW